MSSGVTVEQRMGRRAAEATAFSIILALSFSHFLNDTIQSLVPAIIGAFITFSTVVVYPYYLETPKLWGLTPLADQQIAGLVMKLLGMVYLWILFTIRFFQWFGHEEHEGEKIIDDAPRR